MNETKFYTPEYLDSYNKRFIDANLNFRLASRSPDNLFIKIYDPELDKKDACSRERYVFEHCNAKLKEMNIRFDSCKYDECYNLVVQEPANQLWKDNCKYCRCHLPKPAKRECKEKSHIGPTEFMGLSWQKKCNQCYRISIPLSQKMHLDDE
jgi:hypothetical protein